MHVRVSVFACFTFNRLLVDARGEGILLHLNGVADFARCKLERAFHLEPVSRLDELAQDIEGWMAKSFMISL